MTIQQLQVFLALARTLNYSVASQELFMTRQAVRQNITSLEKDLGGKLIENDRNHLYLTPLGELLAAKAPCVVDSFQELQFDMLATVQDNKPVRLGISAAAIPFFLPGLTSVLKNYEKNYPHIQLIKTVKSNDEIAEMTERGEVDLGIVLDLNCVRGGLHRLNLTSHPSSITVCQEHRYWDMEELSVTDLDGEKMFIPGKGPEFAPLLEAFQQNQMKVEIRVEAFFYQVTYYIHENQMICINRYREEEVLNPVFEKEIVLKDVPPLCSSIIIREEGKQNAGCKLLMNHLLMSERQGKLLNV